QDCRPGEIDLHRLCVKKAIAHTDASLEEAMQYSIESESSMIGKGLYSEGQEARVRPAIRGLMCKYHLVTEFDPSNSGILVVKLNGSSGP
ncbi:hypothetical protein EDD18DRAFT_1017876, partial [Armillaria luteobubalina]